MLPPHYHFHRIESADDPRLADAWDIYSSSFPDHEKRTQHDHNVLIRHPYFSYQTLIDNRDDSVAAIICAWHTQHFIYLEHFAVAEHTRGHDLGTRILHHLCAQMPGAIILEIDPPEDDISMRRQAFYERNHFSANPGRRFIHPPYQPQFAPFPMLLMSHLRPMSDDLYAHFMAFHGALHAPGMREIPAELTDL